MILSIIIVIAMFVAVFVPNFVGARRNIKHHQIVAYSTMLTIPMLLVLLTKIDPVITLCIFLVINIGITLYSRNTNNIIVPVIVPPHKTNSTGIIVTLSVIKNTQPPFEAITESVFFEDEERAHDFAKLNEQYLISINKIYIGK